MRAAGITAEYNPLHNGHIYHISQAKKIAGSDAVVAAMSGNFVQRGEPAIFDKWLRTEHALRNGVDLVVEIPVVFCLGNAGQYARASVRLLESIGCVTHAVFGSESGDTEALLRTADFLKKRSSDLEAETAALRKVRGDMTYPAAREAAFALLASECMSPEEIEAGRRLLRSPNDILALEYVMNTERLIPAAVRRTGAGYNDGPDDSHDIQSASGIREMIREGRDIERFVPDCTGYAASAAHVMDSERWYDILRYAILSSTSEEIDECPSGGEGLGNLLKSAVKTAEDFEQLISAVKSRRYTYTRISRLCMQAMLGIRRGGFGSGDPGYIRVLGFTDKGREILSEMREDCPLPVITNLSKIGKGADGIGEDAMRMLELDIHAADIYNLMNGMDLSAGSDYRKKPIIV